VHGSSLAAGPKAVHWQSMPPEYQDPPAISRSVPEPHHTTQMDMPSMQTDVPSTSEAPAINPFPAGTYSTSAAPASNPVPPYTPVAGHHHLLNWLEEL